MRNKQMRNGVAGLALVAGLQATAAQAEGRLGDRVLGWWEEAWTRVERLWEGWRGGVEKEGPFVDPDGRRSGPLAAEGEEGP